MMFVCTRANSCFRSYLDHVEDVSDVSFIKLIIATNKSFPVKPNR